MMNESTPHQAVGRDAASEASRSSNPGSTSSRSSKFVHIPTGSTIADPSSVEEDDGRTYNGYRQGKYLIPNDGAEQDRLDLQHRMWLYMLDGNLAAAPIPIDQPLTVLDIGTGTGIWAIQFAEQHPTSTVIGTDMSVIQPANAPTNCQFFREDTEEEPWLFEQPFDYIHLRAMCTCFHDARGMVERVFKHLRPGGWIEYQDLCFECIGADESAQKFQDTNPTSTDNFLKRCAAGAAAFGRDVTVTKKYKGWLQEAGFVDVVERPIWVPLNPWCVDPKERQCGLYSQEDAIDSTKACRKMVIASGIAEAEVDDYLERVRDYMRDTSIHAYVPWYVVYGRKPGEQEVVREDELSN